MQATVLYLSGLPCGDPATFGDVVAIDNDPSLPSTIVRVRCFHCRRVHVMAELPSGTQNIDVRLARELSD